MQLNIWQEWFWLPAGYRWSDLKRDPANPQMFKAQMSDLWVSLVCAAGLHCMRLVLQAFVLEPLGQRCGLKKKKFVARTPEDRSLEEAYRTAAGNLKSVSYKDLAKKLSKSEASVRNWFRRRQRASRGDSLKKFVESGWQILFYSCSTLYGIYVLWDAPFMLSTVQIWRGWPQHHVTDGMYWYYMVELGYYWSALVTIGRDTKRKDFTEMLLHHIVTIVLMVFSWSMNFTRIGVVVLLLHDVSDPILNLAKIGSYVKVRWISDPAFACFLAVWFVSRLGLYPFSTLRSVLFERKAECGTSPAFNILQFLLVVLQLLHIIWSYFILKIAYRVVSQGERRDSRSDSEKSSDENSGKAE